jgi:hypothetical protein
LREGYSSGAVYAADGDRRDLIRKEEIPTARLHSVWDAKMLLSGDVLIWRD